MRNWDRPALLASNYGVCGHRKASVDEIPDTISSMPATDIKAIVFDFGGVLLEWDPRNLYRRYFPDQPQDMEKFLAEIHFTEWNLQQDKGRPFLEGVALLSREFPQYADLIRAYHEEWEESVGGAITGTVEILWKLKGSGYPLYGLSNWSAETFPRVENRFPFLEVFDKVILSGEVKLIKPDAAIFRLFLQTVGYCAEECLFIDDSQTNVEVASKLGFQTIQFTTPENLHIELQKLKLLA